MLFSCDKFIKDFLNVCPNVFTVWNNWVCDTPSVPVVILLKSGLISTGIDACSPLLGP